MTKPRCPYFDSRFSNVDPKDLLDHQRSNQYQFDFFATPWLKRASDAADIEIWFEALIYLWVTFNAWLVLAVSDRAFSAST